MAEWFMPPAEGLPTTAEADPGERVLHLVLDQLQPVLPDITAALDAAAGLDTAAYLELLEREQPAVFDRLRVLFIGRYLTCRTVWELLGYMGRRPVPVLEGEAEKDLEGGLLDPVISRGKICRPTPVTFISGSNHADLQSS